MHVFVKLCVSFVALVLTAGASSAHAGVAHNEQAESKNIVSFGLYQSDKASEMHLKFKPLIDYLTTEVSRLTKKDIQFKLTIYASYEAANDALVNGQVGFVRFGPSSYILAKQRQPHLRLLAMEEKKGKTRFSGLVVVKKDSTVEKLADLKGMRFAFGNQNSTIGRYLIQSELVSEGITASDLKHFDYLGRHDKVFKAVEFGDYDAGSLKESTYKKMNKKDQLRVIYRFDNVTKPWIASATLEPEVFSALSDALISLSDPEILKRYKVSAFVPVSDADYEYVREGMQRANRF